MEAGRPLRSISMAAAGACTLFCLLASGHAHAQSLGDFSPAQAQPGTEVELEAEGLDPLESYTVSIAGTAASVTGVEETRLRFVVPAGATSGPIEVGVPGPPPSTLQPFFRFTVLRELDASLDPALGAGVSGHGIGTAVGDGAGPGPVFAIEVPVGVPSLAIAARDETRSVLLQVVTDATPAAEISAASTAQALVFLTPSVRTRASAEAELRLATIAAAPETLDLVTVVERAVAAGTDYADDFAFRGRLIAAARAVEETLGGGGGGSAGAAPGAPAAGPSPVGLGEGFTRGARAYAAGYPRDLVEPIPLLNRLDVVETAPGAFEDGVPNLGMRWEPTESAILFGVTIANNPLDWIATLYELSPSAFPGGQPDVDARVADGTVYPRVADEPFGSLVIASDSAVGLVDLSDSLVRLVTGSLEPPEGDLRVSSERPGVYLVRKFNGARYPPQDALLPALPDGFRQAIRARLLNILILVADGLGYLVPQLGDDNARDVTRIAFGVLLTMEQQLVESSADGLDADELATIRREAASLLARQLLERQELFTSRTALNLLLGRSQLLTAISTVGKAAKLATRTLALENFPHLPNVNLVQAIESSAVVVGNPWRPEITSFQPRQGHRGTVVFLSGRNFSNTPEDNRVGFQGPTSSTPTDAFVSRAAFRNLLVEVPPTAQRGSNRITVERADRGVFATDENAPPFDAFEVLPAPVVTGIEPDPPFPGGLVRVIGSGFSEDMTRNVIVLRDPVLGDTFRSEPVSGSSTELLFRDPTPLSNQQLRVQIEDVLNQNLVVDASNEVPYSLRPPPTGSTGRIFVSSYGDDVAADADVTLREAIHIGAGTLGRALTTCPAQPDGCEREKVLANDGFTGAGVRESILLWPGLGEGGTVNLALGALPAIEGGDSIGILATVDGGGGAFSGVTIDGQTGVALSFLRFANFGGHGIELIDAPETRLAGIDVVDCGGTGVRIAGATTDVEILSLEVDGCAGPGLQLSGAGVRRIVCSGDGAITGNGGGGILLEGGTTGNGIDCGDVVGNTGVGIRVADSPLNAIGNPARSVILPLREVADNTGVGIEIESGSIRLFRQRVRGNGSHGIVIGGEDTTGIEVQLVQVGPRFDVAGAVDPNQGHGILIHDGASNVTIGTRAVGGINEPGPNLIAGNTGFGIVITGGNTRDVVVNKTVVGGAVSSADPGTVIAHGNGLGGIALQDFTHDNRLGDRDAFAELNVIGHTATPGLLIEGGANNNQVVAAVFGAVSTALFSFRSEPTYGNLYGIHIRDGAHSNVIGARGNALTTQPFDPDFLGNSFRNSWGAGMLIESGGSVGTQVGGIPPAPFNSNVVINNLFGDVHGSNEVGLILRAGAQANRIGGVDLADFNNFAGNRKAGLWIDGYAVPFALRNRIVGNVFRDTSGPNLPADPLVQVPDGVGVLVTNASGHRIGGSRPGEKNFFYGNYVGIYDQGGTRNVYRGNQIGTRFFGTGNDTAGVILADSVSCTVRDNEIVESGTGGPGPALGGVAIRGGGGHVLLGNRIGTDAARTAGIGNAPHGVLVRDSTDNRVGNWWSGNQIVQNEGAGVVVEGVASSGNRVGYNSIGRTWALGAMPNLGPGVVLRDGAHDNAVGDVLRAPNQPVRLSGNTIRHNTGHGVLVSGAATVDNIITYNSISENGGAGIRLENGGNRLLPAPILTGASQRRALGTVDAGVVPDGSLVQVFRDGADEGRVRVGEGPVRNGQFVVPIHFAAGNLTATVTVVDPASGERGDTSEFSAFFPVAVSLSLAPLPELQAIDRAAPGGAEILVLPLEARALGGPVRVPSLTLEAMGSLAEDVDIVDVALYRDLDADGRIGEDDERISAPGTFDADDGSVALALEGVSVDTVAAQVWLVGLELSGAAPPASSFELAIPAPTAVAAEALFAPGSPVPVVGPFPIESDAFSVVAADLDSDGDGVFDASDECPATSGGAAVDDVGCSCDQLDARGRFPAGETLACPEPAAALLQLGAAAALLALRRRAAAQTA